jgi:hypothetical protein
MYAMLTRSPSGTSAPATGGVDDLSTGSDSPVSAASWMRSPADSTRRMSAGTTEPGLEQHHVAHHHLLGRDLDHLAAAAHPDQGVDMALRAAIARSARYSWKNPSSPNSTTIARMATASSVLAQDRRTTRLRRSG